MRVKSFPLFISVVKKYLAIKIEAANIIYRIKYLIFQDKRKDEGELLLINLFPRISDMLILTKNIYQLPVSINLILKGYDVLGSEVVTLVNKERPAGKKKNLMLMD